MSMKPLIFVLYALLSFSSTNASSSEICGLNHSRNRECRKVDQLCGVLKKPDGIVHFIDYDDAQSWRYLAQFTNFWNDNVEEVKVMPGCNLNLYEDMDYKGSYLRMRNGQVLTKTMSNIVGRTSSYRCDCFSRKPPCATIFTWNDFRGHSRVIDRKNNGVGIQDLHDVWHPKEKNWYDEIRAMVVFKGCHLKLWYKDDYNGRAIKFPAGEYSSVTNAVLKQGRNCNNAVCDGEAGSLFCDCEPGVEKIDGCEASDGWRNLLTCDVPDGDTCVLRYTIGTTAGRTETVTKSRGTSQTTTIGAEVGGEYAFSPAGGFTLSAKFSVSQSWTSTTGYSWANADQHLFTTSKQTEVRAKASNGHIIKIWQVLGECKWNGKVQITVAANQICTAKCAAGQKGCFCDDAYTKRNNCKLSDCPN